MERFFALSGFFYARLKLSYLEPLLIVGFYWFKKTNVRYFFIDTFKKVVVFYDHGL